MITPAFILFKISLCQINGNEVIRLFQQKHGHYKLHNNLRLAREYARIFVGSIICFSRRAGKKVKNGSVSAAMDLRCQPGLKKVNFRNFRFRNVQEISF